MLSSHFYFAIMNAYSREILNSTNAVLCMYFRKSIFGLAAFLVLTHALVLTGCIYDPESFESAVPPWEVDADARDDVDADARDDIDADADADADEADTGISDVDIDDADTGHEEPDVEDDISSDCTPCEDGQPCSTGADCLGNFCHLDTCVTPRSCTEIAEFSPGVDSGTFVIDPESNPGAPFEVYCDFDADGGVGYTMLRIEDSSLGEDQDDYRAACQAVGMEIIVPRTRAHAQAIMDFNDGDPPNIVGVYAQFEGAQGLHNWEGRCQGQPCTFYMDDSDSAGCSTFEPSGDNTTEAALFRRADGCFFGDWNDEVHNTVSFEGSVICSTNDIGPQPAHSCLVYRLADSVHNAGPLGISGVYELVDASGELYEAFCDMTTMGGGWTLTMKVDGDEETFLYDAPLWTNTELLNPEAPDLDRNEAKLQSFIELPFTQLMVGLEAPMVSTGLLTQTRHLPLALAGSSLQETFASQTFIPTASGRDSWKGLAEGSSLQVHCNREGLNNAIPNIGSEFSRVRVGFLGNEQADCDSPDSRIGLGGAGTSCGQQNLSAGNTARCDADNGNAAIAAMGALFVRNLPIRPSCQAHFDAGITRSGIYPISPDGSAHINAYCEMELAGGGWTLLTINGTDPRPTTWWSNAYPRPGASHYGNLVNLMADFQAIMAGSGVAANYSIDAEALFEISTRQILAFVGGTTTDYITGQLPADCNFFAGDEICLHNTYTSLTILNSDGTVLTDQAQACTTGAGLIATDPFDEFGLHLIEGVSQSNYHCAWSEDSTMGHEGYGRLYSTFDSSNGAYWPNGVHSHWNEGGTLGQAGFLLLR